MTETLHVPIVVVGAGAAGLVAALAAQDTNVDANADANAEILVLERDALPRGSTALSAGLIPAPATHWQRAAGIDDSVETFAADIMRKSEGTADPALTQTVAAAIGPALEWLGNRHGLPFSVITDFRYPGHSAYRMHGLPSRSGLELIDALRAAAEAHDVTILCDAHVTELLPDARGVRYSRPDGAVETVTCDALILACNGYGGDKDLVRRHIPNMADALYFGHPGNQGDALRWGETLGAATRDLAGHQGHGSVAQPAGILITWATITEGGIQVNAAGCRFSDESHGYSEQAATVLQQPGAIAWTIFDARIAAIARQFEDFRQAETIGAVLTAETTDALATAIGVPAPALDDELADAAHRRRSGEPDRFGRLFAGIPALAPPYHAVRVTGALFHTQGGLVVDAAARVLRPDGAPVPRLFAAGGAAAGVSGPRASGYLSGNGLLTAIALGRIAGQAATRHRRCS